MAFVRKLTAWFDRQRRGRRRDERTILARKRQARNRFEAHLSITALEDRILLSASSALMDDGDSAAGSTAESEVAWRWDDPATFAAELGAWLADNPLDPDGPPITIELNPSSGIDHGGLTVDLPDGVVLVIRGGEEGFAFTGASPALEILNGEVIVVGGGNFSTSTDDPTIVVRSGGSLTLFSSTVTLFPPTDEETATADRAAILVEAGGLLDLSSGDNVLEVFGTGQFITWQATTNLTLGTNLLRVDGVDLTPDTLANNFAIEDRVTHALDVSGYGLVTWVDQTLFVTPDSGSLARAVDVAPDDATIHVDAGTFVHDGTLEIARTVTIIGAGSGDGETILLRSGEATFADDAAIRLNAAGVTWQSVTLGGWADPQSSAQLGLGYLVWLDTAADQATFHDVRFVGRDNAGAIHLHERSDFTLTASRVVGTFFSAAVRGAGERMLITGNTFEQSHFAEGPLSLEYDGDVSGEISFNYFISRLGVADDSQGSFAPDGLGLFAIGNLAADRITADGLSILHNSFHFQDQELENELGQRPVPIGIDFAPSSPLAGPLVIRDNLFVGYRFTGPQPDPPADPLQGQAIRVPATTLVSNNVFFGNDIDYDAGVSDPGDNLVGDPVWNLGTNPTDPAYQLGFGGRATYASTAFLADRSTPTPHVGAYQGDPGAFGRGDLFINGSDGDDLLEIVFNNGSEGTARFVRDFGGPNEFDLTDIELTGLTSITFRGFAGDDRLVLEQPAADWFVLTGGITFIGDDASNLLEGNPPGDSLVLIGGEATEVLYRLDDGDAGEVFVNGMSYVRFEGLESIRDESVAEEREFQFAITTTEIELANDPDHSNSSRLTYTLDSIPGIQLSFVNPSDLLTIRTAEDSTAVVRIDALSADFAAALKLATGAENAIEIIGVIASVGGFEIEDSASIAVLSGASVTTAGNGAIRWNSAGAITIAGELSTSSSGNLSLEAVAGIELGADLLADLGDVSLTGDLWLATDVLISTNEGRIEIDGAIDGNQQLELQALAEEVRIAGAIGVLVPLVGLSIASQGVRIEGRIQTTDLSIHSTGNADVELDDDVSVTTASVMSDGDIRLLGNMQAFGAADFTADQDIVLGGTVTVFDQLKLTGQGEITIEGALAAAEVEIVAVGNVLLGDAVTVTGLLSIDTDAGVEVAGELVADAVKITAVQNVVLGDSVTVAGLLSIKTDAGVEVAGELVADAVKITAVQDVVLGDAVTVTGLLLIKTEGGVAVDGAVFAEKLIVRAVADVAFGNSVTVDESLKLRTSGDVQIVGEVQATSIGIEAHDVEVGGAIEATTIESTATGGVWLLNSVTVDSLSIASGGAVDIAGELVADAVNIAADRDVLLGDSVTVAGLLSIKTDAGVEVAGELVADAVKITAVQDVVLGDAVTVTGLLSISTDAGVEVVGEVVAGEVLVMADDDIVFGASVDVEERLELTTLGDVQVGGALDAETLDILASGDVQLLGSVTVGGIWIDSQGEVEIAGAIAADEVEVVAVGDVWFGDAVTVTGLLFIETESDVVVAGAAEAGAIEIFADGSVEFGGSVSVIQDLWLNVGENVEIVGSVEALTVQIEAGGDVRLAGSVVTSELVIAAIGDVRTEANLSVVDTTAIAGREIALGGDLLTEGDIQINSTGKIELGGDLVTLAGKVSLSVTSAGGGVTQAVGTMIVTGNASDSAIVIDVAGTGNVVLAALRTGTADLGAITPDDKPLGQITIQTGGAILANPLGGLSQLITERAELVAGTGIGAVSQSLRTDIEYLTATTTSGVIRILERDFLQLQGVAAPGPFVGPGPQIEILSQVGPIVLLNGTVVESSTGKVSNAPPLLRLVQDDPSDLLVAGDPTQEVSGTLGGIEELGDNLELGVNFRLAVRWNDGVISELDTPLPFNVIPLDGDGQPLVDSTPTLRAGDRIVWLIDANNQSTVRIERAAEAEGPIEVFVQRTYPLLHLQTLREPEVTATLQAFNDRNVVLGVLSGDLGESLNASNSISITTPVAEELIRFAVPIEVDESTVVMMEPQPLFVFDTIPTLPGLVVFYDETGTGETIDEEAFARLYLLRILPNGEVGDRVALPINELRDLSNLLERLKRSAIPSGSYRIDYQEPGLPVQEVLEFRKTGDSIGDPVREPGLGSNPREDSFNGENPGDGVPVEDGAGLHRQPNLGSLGVAIDSAWGEPLAGEETAATASHSESWSRVARQVRKWTLS